MDHMMPSPLAVFDSLSCVHKLQRAVGEVAEAEVHFFLYLSCLLLLYSESNRPETATGLAEWGYSFATTKNGFLFSYEIGNSVALLVRSGLLSQNEDKKYQLSEDGTREYEILKSFALNEKRDLLITAACSCALAMPVGRITDALSKEPELGRAKSLTSARILLDGPGLTLLYEHFQELRAAIGKDVRGLMAPAVIWLTYLSKPDLSVSSS